MDVSKEENVEEDTGNRNERNVEEGEESTMGENIEATTVVVDDKEIEIIMAAEDVNASRVSLIPQPKVRTVDDVIADIKGIKVTSSMRNLASRSPNATMYGDANAFKIGSKVNLEGKRSRSPKSNPSKMVEPARDTRTASQQKIDRDNKAFSKSIFRRILQRRRGDLTKNKLQEVSDTFHNLNPDTSAVGTQATNVLLAFMAFWNPQKRRMDFLVPKDRAAWLEFIVQLVHKKTRITYLSNKELKKVIIRTRPNLAQRKHIIKVDPDCPECFYWNEHQVADWVESVGFPNLKEAFLHNHINGRRLVTVDVNALRQMGMKYFDEMKVLATKIREILGVPRPNILRAIMRMVPYELYLRKRVYNGRTYDSLTFEKFCKDEGFNYDGLKNNKNATIPSTTEVYMIPTGVADDDEGDLDRQGSDEEDTSLLNAPTVEFVVRNSILRNKIVTKIIEDILKSALVGKGRKLYGKGLKETMKDSLGWGFSELGLDNAQSAKERLEFATSVAKALLREVQITSIVLEDIEQVEKYVGEKVVPERLEYLKECAEQFMEDVVPLAAVVAFGELDLETIFRDTTGMEEYIEEVIDEAQHRVVQDQNKAEVFIRQVCDEAIVMANRLKLGYDVPLDAVGIVTEILDEIFTNAFIIEMASKREKASHRGSSSEGQNPMSPELLQQEALELVHMVREEFEEPSALKTLGKMLEIMEQLFTSTNIFEEQLHKTESHLAVHEKQKLEVDQHDPSHIESTEQKPGGQNEQPPTEDQEAIRNTLMKEIMQIFEKLRRNSKMTISVKGLVMETIEALLTDSNAANAAQSVEATRDLINQIHSKIDEHILHGVHSDSSDLDLWSADVNHDANDDSKQDHGHEISVQHTPIKFEMSPNQQDFLPEHVQHERYSIPNEENKNQKSKLKKKKQPDLNQPHDQSQLAQNHYNDQLEQGKSPTAAEGTPDTLTGFPEQVQHDQVQNQQVQSQYNDQHEQRKSSKVAEGTTGTLTGLSEPVQQDQEVNVGVVQWQTKAPNKTRRSELTMSDSMTRGRISTHGSPMTGAGVRKVDSDLAIKRTVFKTNSADSFSSSADTAVRVKSKVENQGVSKIHASLPGSSYKMTDGDKLALRRFESDPPKKKTLSSEKHPDLGSEPETAEQKQLRLKNKQLHRQLLVESWAHESDQEHELTSTASEMDAEENSRIMRITADQIVQEIVQLALTHMLMEAEAGKDTEQIMAALKKIQLPAGTEYMQSHHTVVLWNPNFSTQNSSSTSAAVSVENLRTKEGLTTASKEAIVTAIEKALEQKNQLGELDLSPSKVIIPPKAPEIIRQHNKNRRRSFKH